MSGFKRELDGRLKSIQDARVELERLYGQRIDDGTVDLPENNKFKEECLCAVRAAEASFTSYHGSVRSIKSVIETLFQFGHCVSFFDKHGIPNCWRTGLNYHYGFQSLNNKPYIVFSYLGLQMLCIYSYERGAACNPGAVQAEGQI